ncbi:hypothetical protein CCM_00655 [Cordyceps militaris CM01]|uniref:Uncharacterized protein n=1 Tax=Cordyceps militaris (strain CM01) TaxID=983644 RepID=G3J586_CORMM|nr:uncharacterized protein CCM_00655 [Cordyceps militaris CM01]EGX96000.1 hypothetical protein CCM_00655 [Cordyceps militaris CM01]
MSNQSPWYPCTSFRRRPRQNPQNLRLRRLRSWRATPPDTSVSAPALDVLPCSKCRNAFAPPRNPVAPATHSCLVMALPRSNDGDIRGRPRLRSPLRMPCWLAIVPARTG